jgi:signal transduction histidine kinase/DNA-binding response OmpR family regulator/ligand-binding sensor domain-containing protein
MLINIVMAFTNRFLKLFVVLFVSHSLNAQAYQVKHLSIEDGLSNGTVNAFATDSLGYMWLGTSIGLNRYSGYEIKQYSISDFSNTKNNNIKEVINYNGELYIVGRDGVLLKYRYHQNDFVELFYQPTFQFISACVIDNKIIFGLAQGLLMYDLDKKKLGEVMYSDFTFNRRLIVQEQSVYSATSKGVVVFDYEQGNLNVVDTLLSDKDITALSIDDKNRVWIGTERDGLFVKDNDKTILVPLFNSSLKTYSVRDIAFNANKDAIIAVDRLGLYVVDKSLKVRHHFMNDPDQKNTLRQNNINRIFIDKTDVYWLAVGEIGVDLLYSKDNPFDNISHVLNEKNSIHNNIIRSIYEDEEKNLWFGTEDGVGRRSKDGTWSHFNKSLKLEKTSVLSINEYQGELIFGTYGEGLLTINSASGDVTELLKNQQKKLNLIFSTFTKDDELWVGGNDGPLSLYNKGEFVQRFPSGIIKCILEGADDFMYVASAAGVYRLNKRNYSFQKLEDPQYLNQNVLGSAHALYLDSNQKILWIGNDAGIHSYDLKENEFKHYDSQDARKLGIVYSIQQDNDGFLWMGTSTGLWRFNLQDSFFRQYGQEEGLEANEFGFGASTKLRDGRLAFGGPDGAVIFDPEELEQDAFASNLFVSDFKINGVQSNSIINAGDINYQNKLALDYDQNSLSFTAEVLKFHGPKKDVFQWQLIGSDENPILSEDSRTVSYSNLPSGTYILNITSFNADGVQSPHVYRKEIIIKKPFWKTWWAYIGYFFILGALGVLIILTGRAKNQQRFSDEKIKFFVDVAHDIRTPVTLIQLLINQLPPEDSNKDAFELIKRNANSLSEYVSQLLEFQKSERQKLKLSVEEVKIKSLLKLLVSDFQPLLERKSMDLEVKAPDVNIWVDKNKMSSVINNLISNAIKYGEEGGSIKILVKSNEENIKIKFSDNGLGVPEKQQKQIFTRFTRGDNVNHSGISGSGIGLMLAKRIVELHQGKISLQSKENIGSTFIVELQKGSKHFKNDEIKIIETIDIDYDKIPDIIGENKLALLVEDNEDLRAIIKAELDKSYRVIEAPNGKEGLVLAIEKNPDIIITDVMMPLMNGKELCKIIKSNIKTSHIPVVMITALGDVEDKVEGLDVGADAYVEKPFSIEVLKATINNLLRTRRALGSIAGKENIKKANYTSPDEQFLSSAVELIKENITERNFTIDVLCEKLGFSRSNLFRKLKGLTGMTPSDLIIKIKLNHAVELFKSNQNMRIADIAYESGFHDPKYFSTVFKKFYGKTPKQFMKSQEN